MGMGTSAEGFCPLNGATGSARPPRRGHGTWGLVQSVEQEQAGLGDGAMPLQRLCCLHKAFCKATVSLSAGGDAGTCDCCSPAIFPGAQSSRSPSPPPCSGAGSCSRRASHGAVTRVPAELQHSRETAFICCDSFATDSLAELTANCNPKLSDGSFFQPGSVRNKFVWVIKTY